MTGSWASCPSFSQVKALTRYFSEIFICSSSRSARGNLPVTGNAKKCEGDRNQSIQMSNVPVPRIVAGASGTFAAGRDRSIAFSRTRFAQKALPFSRISFRNVGRAANDGFARRKHDAECGRYSLSAGQNKHCKPQRSAPVSCDCYRTVKQNIAAIIVPEKSASTSSLRRGRVFGRISGRLS